MVKQYTITEIAKIHGVNRHTLQMASKRVFGDRIKAHTISYFNENEIPLILAELKPKVEHYQRIKSIEGNTAIIDIDGNDVLIDSENVERVMALQWDIVNKENAYAVHYGFKNGKRKYKHKNLFLHRFLIDAKPKDVIDHINNNTLDNRIANLQVQNKNNFSVKELENVFNVTRHAIARRCVALFPEKGGQGNKIFLTENEYAILKADFNKPYTPEPHEIVKRDKLIMVIEISGYHVIIDTTDYELISKYRWGKRISKDKVYFDYNINFNGRNNVHESLHRTIMGAKKGEHVDHINGDTLDNRKSNLRICTNAENSRNSKISKNNTSGFKGVMFVNERRRKKWVARIWKDRKVYHLGHFKTPEAAYAAYCKAAKELHGEFARFA